MVSFLLLGPRQNKTFLQIVFRCFPTGAFNVRLLQLRQQTQHVVAPQFGVEANKGDAGIVRLVLFLQIDVRPHASLIQRLDPLAVVNRIGATRISTRKQPIFNYPIRATTRCRLGWVGEREGDNQSKSPMESDRLTPLDAALQRKNAGLGLKSLPESRTNRLSRFAETYPSKAIRSLVPMANASRLDV